MGNAVRKAVFLDIDGTIMNGEKGGPFANDIEAVERARRKGHCFLLCTGRGYGHIPPSVRDAPWVDGVVSGGGAHVITGGKDLYRKTVPVQTLCEISALFLALGKQCTFQGGRALYGINKNFASVNVLPESSVVLGSKIPIHAGNDFEVKYPGADIEMMTIDKTIDEAARKTLERHFDLYSQIPHFDALIKGENKAKGMDIALSALGISLENSVAIGDSDNDLDMIRHAGTGIAVGNACAALKEAADWISAPCGEGGVARALEYLGMS
jgi:Cof subfamily protein (haloacid dehalogenase superfamily)